ncbi:lipopolysaccharide biosynthesis protein [Sphingomonas sp. GM_Shp_1]|uniref:lipopolysaccharide biosynthesis protein n=1 Tax=Sphingomonas sp. GM_Shp_1 TaxID=2937381 RepID=UPI00226B6C15|nr:lipopolysaccharide biosynthesis protein [Sphingomonas sp. GM_Shp_1]
MSNTAGGVGKRIAKGSMWLTAARVVVNLSGMVSTVILARLLVPADFGLVAIAATLMQIVTSITEMSLSQALIRLDEPTDADFHSAWTLSALRGVTIAVVLSASSPFVANIYGDQRLIPILIVLGGGALLSGLANPWLAVFQRRLVFWQEFVLSSASKMSNVIVAVAVAWYFQSYWAIVAGIVAMYASNVIVSYCIMPRLPRFSLGSWRTLLSFSVWTSASQLVNALNWRADQLMVGKIATPTVLGYYNVAFNLANLATRETTLPLTKTLFPAFASIKHDKPRLTAAYIKADRLLVALGVPVGVGFALVAEPMVALFLNAKWLPAVPIIQAFAVIFGLQGVAGLATPLGMALGYVRLLFMRDLQVLLVRLPLMVLGAIFFGVPGLVATRVLAGLYQVSVGMMLARRLAGVSIMRQIATHMPTLIGCITMSLGVWAVADRGWRVIGGFDLAQELILRVIVGGLVYLVTRFAIWFAMGRPEGLERDAAAMLGKLRRKLA